MCNKSKSPDAYRESGTGIGVNENITIQLLPYSITNDITFINKIYGFGFKFYIDITETRHALATLNPIPKALVSYPLPLFSLRGLGEESLLPAAQKRPKPICAVFKGADLGLKINMHQTKARVITFSPFKIIK